MSVGKILEELSARIEKDLGLVANLVLTSEYEKIVGGVSYDHQGEIDLYVRKYEISLSENEYHIKLPVGQCFLMKSCGEEDDVIRIIVDHFYEYHKDFELPIQHA